MSDRYSRRQFCKTVGWGVSAAVLGGCQSLKAEGSVKRRLKIGHTGITWGFKPEGVVQALKDVASLGYHGFESFPHIMEHWDKQEGGFKRLLDEHNMTLIGAYCGTNLTDPTKLEASIKRAVQRGKLIKKHGGTVSVIGPNGVKRASYNFKESKKNIVHALNEVCKALADIGIIGAVHQHTGTCIETRDEVYATMEAVDTRYVKFGPDVGQLQKGGADPVPIVKDFISIIEHVHLKDWRGEQSFLGYCPLGQGKVNLPAIMDLLEKSDYNNLVMVELDVGKNPPITPLETAKISKAYLESLGYQFRA